MGVYEVFYGEGMLAQKHVGEGTETKCELSENNLGSKESRQEYLLSHATLNSQAFSADQHAFSSESK